MKNQKKAHPKNGFAFFEKRYHKKFVHSDIYGFIAVIKGFGLMISRQNPNLKLIQI